MKATSAADGRDSILVKANNWLGDAVMSLPTLEGLKRMHPRARIAVLSLEHLADLYRLLPYVDEVLPYRTALQAVRQMRSRTFQSALILPRSFRSALLAVLARIPTRVGYAADARSALLTVVVPRDPEFLKTHRVYYFYNLLRGFGPPPPVPAPRLPVPDEARSWARERLRGSGSKLKIGINPGAAYGEAKRWGEARFAAVGKRLIRDADATILVLGGPSEADLGGRIAEAVGPAAQNWCGKTTLPQLAGLLAEVDLLITNDTGPMHLADAVGCPVVAIFGPTDPVTTRPFGRNHIVVRHAIDCSPCLERTCPLKHHLCMDSIQPNEVLDAAWKILKRGRRSQDPAGK